MVLAPQRGALLPGSGQHNATSVTMDVGRYRELGVIEEMALADLLVVDVIRSPGSTLSHAGKELRNDHERWRDIQEYYADLTKVETI